MKRRLKDYWWCLLLTNLLGVPGLAEELPKGGGPHCTESEFEEGFIKARHSPFSMQSEKQQIELKKIFLCKFNNILNDIKPCFPDRHNSTAELSCSNFFSDKNVQMKLLKKNKSYYWYPTVHYNENVKELQNNFEKCNGYLGILERNVPTTNNVDSCTNISSHLRYTLIPCLPWKCQVDNEFSRKTELLVYLHTINNNLSRNCGDLICNITKIDTSITILSLNRATDQLCIETLNEINDSPSCYPESDGFCFYALIEPNTGQSIVFISKDHDTISENEKLVYILRKINNRKDCQENGWCERPLNDTITTKHLHKIQTYYFCSSGSINNTSDSWCKSTITESKTLVALNANVSVTTIECNVILQRLLSNKNTKINTTVYDNILKSNYTFEHSTDAFNISVFNANHTEIKVIEDVIKQEKDVNITITEYFTKVEDTVSIWGYLNWIIFHSCSHEYKKDDKDLFLFLYNGPLNLEYICNDSTAVLLTSIRGENVTNLNSTQLVRGCFDKGITDKNNNKDCINNLQSGTDYETRFFHFLIYPRNMDKLSVLNLTGQKMENNEIEYFRKTFLDGSHPPVRGGFTKIVNDEKKSSAFDHKEQTISLQKTLQILIMASLSGNSKCLKTLMEDSFSIEINPNSTKPLYVIGPVPFDISDEYCLIKILPYDVYNDLNRIKENKMLRVNKFWPICMYNKLIAWDGNTTGVVLEWDYLSSSCKDMETALFIFCCVITFITISGNTVVIAVIILSRLIKKHVFMIYTSMAVADLLLGVTSALQALRDTYYLRSGQLTIYNFDEKGPWAKFGTLAHNQPAGFQLSRFPRKGWPAICAVAMNISILSSLMSLALLGTERLLMFLSILTLKDTTSEANNDHQNDIQPNEKSNRNHNHSPIRFRDPFVNTRHTKITISIIWVWNIICAVVINIGGNNNTLTGLFDPITKLTLNTGNSTSSHVVAVFYLQATIGSIAGIIIVTATVASAIIFNIHESKKQLNSITIHHPQRQEQVYFITRTFIMMVILFLVTSVPVAVGILTNSLMFDFSNTSPTFHFVIWWLFMAGSSWNWIIYCFRGQLFKEKAKELCQSLCGSL